MNGGISDTTTTPTGQTNDPAALLSTLMASAGPENANVPRKRLTPVAGAGDGTPKGTLKDGIFGYGYYDDATGTFTPAERPDVTPVEPPPIRPPRPRIPPGEGSVNEDARKRGEALTAFLASFQAAYQRNNPNFNFTRNPRLAAGLGLPWSGDLGR